ncbi:MAG: GPW/gp25 family protein [Lachnospiraceae bacterium]
MTQTSAKEFLGCGMQFPIQVDSATGRFKEAEYDENILESIRIIITTKKGERLMRPEFGCGIHEYAFETLDYTTLCMLQREVVSALTIWEPRITDIDVIVDSDSECDGKVLISVSYLVRMTNNPYNLVYPYFLNEGEN